MSIRIACAVVFLFTAGAVHAADNGFYLGAAVSQSQVDDIAENIDLDDTGYKLIAGFRPLDIFSVELNYMDLGSDETLSSTFTGDVEATAIAGFGVLYLALPFVDLYGKAGLAYWETKGDSTLAVGDLKDDGTEFAYGAGVQARFGSLAARLEYESFDLADSDGLDLFSLGVTWTFL